MRILTAPLLAIALFAANSDALAANSHSSPTRSTGVHSTHGQSSSKHTGGHNTKSTKSASHIPSHSKAMPGVKRDPHGKIARSAHAKDEFRKHHPCPSTGKTTGACPGYVIDHVRALKHGGTDTPSNMQWQSKQAAKAKDRVE